MSQKAKNFNKLEEKNGSLYVKSRKHFKPFIDVNEYAENSARWAFSQKHFKNKGDIRSNKEIMCDAIQGKLGEFAVYKFLKGLGYDIQEPDYTSIRDYGEADNGDLFLGDLAIQVKTHTDQNNLFRLKKEEFDENGVYHNWGKTPIHYTYFFMCRINPGVRSAFQSIGDASFDLNSVLDFLPHINFRIEITGFININDFKKIISEKQYIPANTKINNSYSFKEDYYYCQSGDLREIDEIKKKK